MNKKISDLPHVPGENPFIVARGGFYRRWLQMIDNLDEFEDKLKVIISEKEKYKNNLLNYQVL